MQPGPAQASPLQVGHNVAYSGPCGQPAQVQQVRPGRHGVFLPQRSVRQIRLHEINASLHLLQPKKGFTPAVPCRMVTISRAPDSYAVSSRGHKQSHDT